MKPVTWIHTADLHLDQPIKEWYGSKEKGLERREDYRQTFMRIISIAKKKNADFLFIAGDFLEHGFVQASTVHFVKEQFNLIPDIRIMISPGNHDPYRMDSFYFPRESWPANVHIFAGEWEELYFEEYNLTICGKGFSDYTEKIWKEPSLTRPEGRNIMLVHGTFFFQQSHEGRCVYFPILEKEVSRYPFDYIALGHMHTASVSTLNNARQTRICYPGSPEALTWKETGARCVIYGRLDDQGVYLEPEQVHTRRYERIESVISHCESREDILARVIEDIDRYEARHCFQIVLKGRYSPQLDLNLELFWLNQQIAQRGLFYFILVNHAKPDFDLSFYREHAGIEGMFVRKMEEKMRVFPERKTQYELALFKGLEVIYAQSKGSSCK